MSQTIYANTKQLDQISELLGGFPKDASIIMNRVLSRAADTVRVETGRQIPKVFGAPQKEIKSALSSKQRKVKTIMGASGEGSVSVEVLGRPLTMPRFRHTPASPPGTTKKGKRRVFRVKAMISRESGMKTISPVHGLDGKNKPVFLMPSKRDNGGVSYLFAYRTGTRKGKKEKLKVIRTLSIPQMVTNEQVGPVIIDKVNQTVFKRLTHELDQSFGNLGTNLAAGGK